MRFLTPTLPPPSPDSTGRGPASRGRNNKGFSLLEMVIAIFIIAVVLGFSLIAMGKGMGLSAKSSDVAIATAIAEQEMARVKNIPFPPTTYNGQGGFINTGDPTPVPATFNNDFEVQVLINSYAGDMSPLTNTVSDHDNTMLRQITVRVRRTRDQVILVTLYTYIARNGKI